MVMGLFTDVWGRELLKSWWVFLFILLCCIGYEQGLKKLHVDYRKLHGQHRELQAEFQRVLHLQERLYAELESFADPDWVELVLMKELGLVPENQTKIYFSKE
jgi:hypothetical protein